MILNNQFLFLIGLISISNGILIEALRPKFKFTSTLYNVTIPENSIGEIYGQPILEKNAIFDTRMGIQLQPSKKSHQRFLINEIEIRIVESDDSDYFIAEKKIIGDFCFLLIRTKANNNAIFNRERKDRYYLNIKAVGSRQKKHKAIFEAMTAVTVIISDVNDLSPFFLLSEYETVVPEDLPVHSNIRQVTADDADLGMNGEVYYSFDQNISDFTIHPTSGLISLIRPLNFQSKTYYEFKVIAQDRASILNNSTTNKAECQVEIRVRQVNLFAPEIRIKHLPQIVEHSNVDVYAIVTVIDQDAGIHGEIRSLDIIQGDDDGYFRVRKTKQRNEFNIEVYKFLDRERTPLGYNLTLRASDNGIPRKESIKTVNVRLIDSNDNSPVFDREFYEVKISENALINSLVTRVKVVDYDLGKNAEVLLEIVGGNEKRTFFINSKTGVLYTAQNLDFETQKSYSLTVTAIDQGNAGQRKQSAAKIMISVMDANDNSPIFDQPISKVIYLNENEPAGTYVTTVVATDADFGENAFVSYSIANIDPNSIPFTIHSVTGEIRTTKLLDYETMKREYRLQIRASDWGYPYRRENEMVLKIKIRDVNDNRPQFEKIECIGLLPKSISRAKELFQFLAIDFDSGAEITYRIVSGNEDNCFYLDSMTGVLKTLCDFAKKSYSSSLYYEKLKDFDRELNITATDGTHFSDINRIRLKFSLSSKALNNHKMDFNCKDTRVLNRFNDLLALSNENNNNNSNNNNNNNKHISDDYNQTRNFDENLFHPEFIHFPEIIKINESIPISAHFYKIEARDQDKNYNGKLVYVISNGDSDSLFNIDMYTGSLYTIGYLDREKRDKYFLNITVSDLGKPKKSISRILAIEILDTNDNKPIILKTISTIRFLENIPINSIISKIEATDADIGPNSEIRYELLNEKHNFQIDSKTGLIRLKKPFDRELQDYYELIIRAIDNNGDFQESKESPLFSDAIIKIFIDDVNDNVPKFHLNLYKSKIFEDVPIGTMALIVNAFDPDLGENAIIRYCMKQFSDNPFIIDPLTGAIKISKKLDYEKRQSYNLSIFALNPISFVSNHTNIDIDYDCNLNLIVNELKANMKRPDEIFSETKVIINVIDVNENLYPPRFSNDFVVSCSVQEQQLTGTFVVQLNATDADNAFDNKRISFSIRGGDGLGLFSIDHFGVIRTAVVLDYGTKPHYWLTVYAQDNGIVPLYSSIQVYVEVIKRIEVPMAEKPIYFANVLENSPAGTTVLSINLITNNKFSYINKQQLISYRIISNSKGYFSIDDNGLITTTIKNLDREVQKEYELEIEIFDKNSNATPTRTFVVITVIDVNDNSPKFHQAIYKIQIPYMDLLDISTISEVYQNMSDTLTEDSKDFHEFHEIIDGNLKTDFPILRVLAIDNDIGINGEITYEIISGSGLDNYYINSTTGKIFMRRNLKPGYKNELTILATDGGVSSRNSTCKVVIEVVNVTSENNHEPICKNFQMHISENEKPGFLLTVIQATDLDNDVLWYDIIDGDDMNQLYMDRESGAIFLAKQLDWEKKRQYFLNISITDIIHVIFIELTLNVIDVNDNRPEFPQSVFSLNLSENLTVGSKIFNLSANDRDNDSKLFYHLYNAKHLSSLKTFQIDPDSNALTLSAPLDREVISQHILTISVHDDGIPQLKNYLRLLITVDDFNDFTPTFTDEYLEGKVYDSATIGSVVLRPYAIDHDKGENSRITYSIISGNVGNVFVIDPIFGTIQLAVQFSNVLSPEYTLLIKANDNGNPSLSSVIPAKIFIVMADNDAPKFIKNPFISEIYENLPSGTFIVHVEAKSMSSLQYEITSGNLNNEFLISPSSGVILTQKSLDFEEIKMYNLTVSATNMAGVKSFCTIIIHVLDVNDNSPNFEQLFYVGNITEMSPINTLLFTNQSNMPLILKATDADSGSNSLLNYEIVESLAKKYFIVDPNSGAVRNIKLIDFEIYQKFLFHVKLSDSGKSSLSSDKMAEILVYVNDINDCIPRFEKSFYNATVWLPTYKNVAILQAKAIDEDSERNLIYDIMEGNLNNEFTINKQTGLILINKSDLKTDKYLLYIRVSDGKYTNITLVNIKVKKPIDTGLKFQKNLYTESIVENSTKVTNICFLNILGNELNEVIEFRILNPTDMFYIRKSSGVIQTTGKVFDRELKPYHELIVEARSNFIEDNGLFFDNGIRVAHTIVNVTVLDINDNCPMFVNLPYYAVAAIDDDKGTVITKVHAIDLDESINGQVRYELKIGRGDLFEVVRENGDIVLKQNLKGHSHEFDLVIAAFDGGENRCQVQVNVHIKVIDKSIPIFQKQFYTESVAENIEINSALSVSIKAESQLDRKLIYNIVKGNDLEKFALDFNTASDNNNGPCIIQVIDELDFETQNEYSLVIRATDSVTGVYAEVPVVITIKDINDCPPEFNKDVYNVSVLETLQPYRFPFLQVKTKDNDTGINKIVSYSIFDDSNYDKDVFQIDSVTGDIYLKKHLNHEFNKQHHFIVVATDSGVPNLSNVAHVWVNVLDVNDNSPQFLLPNYYANISIEAKRNQFITIVKAIDPDFSDRFNLKYNIISGNDEQIFSIDCDSGIVRVQNLHKFGIKKKINLKVAVSDGVYTNFTHLHIKLMPANLNSPVFLHSEINFHVLENQWPNKLIKGIEAVDLDFGEFAKINYTIFSEKYQDLFVIDENSGEIRIKKKLDREQQKSYSLLIKATDGGYRSAFITVNIFVRDVNDNKPEFYYQEYTTTIYSNQKIIEPFLKVSAFDLDEGDSAKIKYSIYEVENSGALNLFTINSATGDLSLRESISKWEGETFQFFVRAEDFGVPILHSDIPISIFVASSKDVVPEFESNLEIFLFEDSHIDTEIAILKSLNNISVNYRIVSNKSQFSIDNKGVLRLHKNLDYETQPVHRIAIIAETDSSPPLSSLIEIVLYVRDINEANFEFESDTYNIDVSETVGVNTSLLKVTAYDMSSKINTEIQYQLSDDNDKETFDTFTIDSRTGWISNLKQFDYETRTNFKFYVTATDSNLRSISKAVVLISIQDYNDNPTLFKRNLFNAEIYENAAIGDIVLMLETTDKDYEANNFLKYYIIFGDLLNQFSISEDGSNIFVANSLDRESVENYSLKILVSDGTFTDEADVFIHVLDVNDNPPYCLNHKYEKTIPENISIDTFLLKIETYDIDVVDSKHIQYNISGDGINDFYFDEKTGTLKTLYSLDRESQSKYSFIVKVSDNEIRTKECSSQIELSISDINDNAPKFLLPYYSVSIMEDAKIGTVVTKIHASDNDIGKNRKIKYQLLDSANGHFSMMPENGILILSKPLDRETISMYNLTAQAKDYGIPSLKSNIQIIVYVQDVNDNPPEFTYKYYSIILSESSPVDSEVIKVTATSKDIGINAEIVYSLISGNEHSKFKINSDTGLISVGGVLDYEKVREYFLTVKAMDHGIPPLENIVNVNISIKDENDNKPVFSRDLYVATIREDAEIGDKILQVIATDMDSRDNGVISYVIRRGNKQRKFHINEYNGYISVADNLDRETTSFYVLEIEAHDHGTPSLSAFISVNIEISDANDNPPIFSQSNFSVIVQEDKPIGYPILHLNVTDADMPPNTSPFTFDIRAGNEAHHFHLDIDGILRISSKLNYKHQNKYLLNIRVFDNGDPLLYSDTFVSISIIEESIHAPVITPLDITINFYSHTDEDFNIDDFENKKIEIGKVFVTDQDPYDVLSYQLANVVGVKYSLMDLFEIDQYNGILKTGIYLDSGEYMLNVTVSDGKFTSFSMIKILVQTITDDVLSYSILIRFRHVSAEKFILSHRKSFVRAIRNIINSNINDILLISVQHSNISNNEDLNSDILDVLFSIRNPVTKFFYSSEYLRKILNEHLNDIEKKTKLNIEQIDKMFCNNAQCNHKGYCEIKVAIDSRLSNLLSTDVTSFLSLNYLRKVQCKCKNGYSGDKCQFKINECALDPCPAFKNCVPDTSHQGYSCQCTDGFAGPSCEIDMSKCVNNSCYIPRNPISFSKHSFILYTINELIADQIFKNFMDFSLYFRTIYSMGVLFYTSGLFDYNFLEIFNGNLQYRYDLGSGEGIVRVSSVYVSDGNWHQVHFERKKNNVMLTVDGNHIAYGTSPGFAEILNLHKPSFYIGAEVHKNLKVAGFKDNINGFIGCMDQLKFNEKFLPFHATDNTSEAMLEYLSNVSFNCSVDLNHNNRFNLCLSQPCLNGGTCRHLEDDKFEMIFMCDCLPKYHGSKCEIDTNPCASSPCLNDGKCTLDDLKFGSYKCDCINNTQGKRCEYGKYCLPNPCHNSGICEEGEFGPICKCINFMGEYCDIDVNECEANPCFNGATCVNEIGSFRCICAANFTGVYCNKFSHINILFEAFHRYSNTIYSVIIAILSILLILILILILIKRYRKKTRNRIDLKNNDSNREQIILNSTKTSSDVEFKRSSKMSNLDVNHRGELLSPIQRPLSYTPSSNNEPNYHSNNTANVLLNNLDILRNYGSAADDLENLPYHYIRNLNKQHSNCTDNDRNKVWTEQISLGSLNEPKLKNDNKQINNENISRLFNTYTNYNLVLPLLNDTVDDSRNLEAQVYHWDCSDWVNRSQNPLPNITEIPGSEIADSSSFHSSGSTECTSQKLPNDGPIDSTRDIDTLNEDVISQCLSVDSDREIFQSSLDNSDLYYKTEVKFQVDATEQNDCLLEEIQPLYKNHISNSKANRRNSYYEVIHSLDEKDSLLKLSPSYSNLSINFCDLDEVHVPNRTTESKWVDKGNIQQTAV